MTLQKDSFNTVWRRTAAFIFAPFLLLVLFAIYELLFDHGTDVGIEVSAMLTISAVAYAFLRGLLWIICGESVPLYFKK